MTTNTQTTTPPAADAAARPAGGPGRPGPGGPGGPQQRGGRRRQQTRYGRQMEEKQNLKKMYGVREEQLKRYYAEALRHSSETGPRLVVLLESRLDNALFRAGFAETRRAARQMASHRLVSVNDRPVTIPSMRLKPGDVVAVRESKRKKPLFENFEKRLQNVDSPEWLTLEGKNFSFKVASEPAEDAAAIGVDMRSVVEYFAR